MYPGVNRLGSVSVDCAGMGPDLSAPRATHLRPNRQPRNPPLMPHKASNSNVKETNRPNAAKRRGLLSDTSEQI